MKTEVRAGAGFSFYELMIVLAVISIVGVVVVLPQLHRGCRAQPMNCINNLKQISVAFRLTQGDITPGGGIYLVSLPATNSGIANAVELQSAKDGDPSPYTYQVFASMSNELNTPKLLVCPTDERTAHTNFNMNVGDSKDPARLSNRNLSYFAGRDVREESSNMIQCGDRNLGTGEKGPNSDYGYSGAPGGETGYAKELGLTNATVQWTGKMHNKQGNVLFADGHVENLTSIKFREALRLTGDTNGTATKGNFLLFP